MTTACRAVEKDSTNEAVTYTYEEAFERSREYFNGDELAANVFLDKYALRNREQQFLEATPEDMHRRIAKEFARVEAKKFKNPMTEDQIFAYLDRFQKIVPQGSPMYGIGNSFQTISLSNCFVLDSPLDSYGGIHHTDEQLSQIAKRRGGAGLDISHLRPSGAATHNAARTSTGILPFMERFSNSTREVGQSGRRGALMTTIDIHHPESVITIPEGEESKPIAVKNENFRDIETTTEFYDPERVDFASIKYDRKKVTGSNISMRLSDEFMNAVKKGESFEQRWPCEGETKISKQTDAKAAWRKIIQSAWEMAEPGLLFWDNIINESVADCYDDFGFKTTCTNPCSEIPLPPLDSCRLLLLNLMGYVVDPWTPKARFDFEAFYKDAGVAQRLMDDLIDLEIEKINAIINKIDNDPEPKHIKRGEREMWQGVLDICKKGRRTGTGITALGDAMAAVGIKYGSQKSVNFTNKIYENLKLGAYRSSVDIAKEIGSFECYDYALEKNCPFIKRIKEEDENLYKDMKRYGRRNIALLTTAPAGSVSILTQTTSGIEPLFVPYYTRRKKVNPNDNVSIVDFVDQSGDCWQEFLVTHPKLFDWAKVQGVDLQAEWDKKFAKLLEKEKKKDDQEVIKRCREEALRVVDKYIEKSPWYEACADDLDWKFRVKLQASATKHVDHAISSTINLPNDVSVDKVAEIYECAWEMGCKGITVYRDGCRSGVMVKHGEKEEDRITKTNAPKRPREIPADIHHTSVKGDQYFVLVGLLNGDEPYEVFAGRNGFIAKSVKSATIKKIKRGHYEAILDNGEKVENIAEHVDDEQEAITRMVSASLRHGADINFVVHQLEKTRGDLWSFAKALSRCLKKHIPDGSVVHGETCDTCGGEHIQRREGCVTCMDCGWSRCS